MSPIVTVIIAVVCLSAGCAGGFSFFRYILTGKYKDTMDKAEKAAEVIKEKKQKKYDVQAFLYSLVGIVVAFIGIILFIVYIIGFFFRVPIIWYTMPYTVLEYSS